MSAAHCASPQRRYGEFHYAIAKKSQLRSLNRYEKPAGLLITLYVHIAYKIALRYEGCVSLMFFTSGFVTNIAADHSRT